MPGGEVSVPTHQTIEQVKEEWQQMANDGQLSLGEYNIQGGELKHTETTVYSRKIPLLELREKLLRKHKSYMYLHIDNQLSGMTKAELMELYRQLKMQLLSDLSEDR